MSVDFSVNSAPLPGTWRPSAAEVSKVLQVSRRRSWRPPQALDGPTAQSRFKWILPLCLCLAIGVWSYGQWGVVTWKPGGLDFSGCRTLHVICAEPGPELLEAMRRAHLNGARVTLVCGNPLEEPFRVVPSDKALMAREGALIDGVTWKPLH